MNRILVLKNDIKIFNSNTLSKKEKICALGFKSILALDIMIFSGILIAFKG